MLLTCRLSQSRTQAKGVPGSPDRGGGWHEKPSGPTEGRAARAAGGALRQTTAAALALMSEETENNHPRTTTPSLSYWVCSRSASPNIQIFPPWVFIRTFLSSGFCSQFLFHPPRHPRYCFELLGNTYSATGSSCKSFNSVLQPV